MTAAAAGFLAAICADPADDAPRLVYADWLDEHGETERAEFIRVQCALAKKDLSRCGRGHEWRRVVKKSLPVPLAVCDTCGVDGPFWPDVTAGVALRRRERELLYATGNNLRWLGACGHPGDDFSVTYRRGFVESVTCAAADWLAHGRYVARCHPLTRVTLSDVRPHRGWAEAPASQATWCLWKPGHGPVSAQLPVELWRALVQPGESYPLAWDAITVVNEPTEDALLGRLSAAALAWARSP